MIRHVPIIALMLTLAQPRAAGEQPQSQPVDACRERLREAVQAVARSGSAEAQDRLIEAWVAPLAESLNAYSNAAREERVRLAVGMQRVTAHLRLRLFRAQLEPADQARLDQILARERPLLEALFHDDDRVRLAALDRIPLEPDTAAGLLIVAKLNDDSLDVIERALAKARALHDASVLRGLRRFTRAALDELPYASAKLEEIEFAIVLGTYLENAAAVLAEFGTADDAPLITEVIEAISTPSFRPFLQSLNPILDSLGRIGDERVAPTLLTYLGDETLQTLARLPNGSTVSRSTGDAALLALARIYGIPPEALGFVSADPKDLAKGFTDGDRRARAHLAFRKWFDENGRLPRDQRAPLAPIAEGGK